MDDPAQRDAQLRALGGVLGFTVNDISLFDQALTHASVGTAPIEQRADYESLEFLGDAVLGLVVAHHLYETRPGLSPGDYSRLRASLVNRKVVARVGVALGIAPYIRLGKGEELSGGRKRDALLADCLEALIGALYLDSGWETARNFVVETFHSEFERAEGLGLDWDFKSQLQNHCQGLQLGLPKFEVIRSEGPDHRKEFEVEVFIQGTPHGRGRGTSKKEAEQNAAREALANVAARGSE